MGFQIINISSICICEHIYYLVIGFLIIDFLKDIFSVDIDSDVILIYIIRLD